MVDDYTPEPLPEFDKLIRQVYESTAEPIPEYFANALAEVYMKSVFAGYKQTFDTAEIKSDIEMLKNLEKNVYQFSAAKTYQEAKVLQKLLTNDSGQIRSYESFRKEAANINKEWNENWQKAEYQTAQHAAQMASTWNSFEKNEVEMLEYSTIGDDKVCPICKPFDGVILPKNNSFWSKAMPPNHFNCYCVVLPSNSEKASIKPSTELIPKPFQYNSGKENHVFSSKHPYFDGVPKKAINNFLKDNLPEHE